MCNCLRVCYCNITLSCSFRIPSPPGGEGDCAGKRAPEGHPNALAICPNILLGVLSQHTHPVCAQVYTLPFPKHDSKVCSSGDIVWDLFNIYFPHRTYLAALHFNENSGRKHAKTRDGTRRWLVKYPKATKAAIAAPIKDPSTYAYVGELMDTVIQLCNTMESYSAEEKRTAREEPPSLSSMYEHGDKAHLVAAHQSRFNHLL